MEDCAKAKKVTKHTVFVAKRKALDGIFSNKDDLASFCIAKQIMKQNQDIVGEKCVMITSWPTLIQQRKMHGSNIMNVCLT